MTKYMSLLRMQMGPARVFWSFKRLASPGKHCSNNHGSPDFSARPYDDLLADVTQPLEAIDTVRHVVRLHRRTQVVPTLSDKNVCETLS